MSIQMLLNQFCTGRNASKSCEPIYITTPPPPVEDSFSLRKSQEDKLYRALCQRGRQILLYAPGGMGKTHMARNLFYRLRGRYKQMAWVSYGSGIRMSMSMPQMDNSSDNPNRRFVEFIRALEEEPDTILFIDDAKESAVNDRVLAQLTGLGITILLTSRCEKIPPYESWQLEPVTRRECANLFYAYYEKDPKQKYRFAVETLADWMERNIFAIRLLAAVVGDPAELPRMAEVLEEGSLMDHIGQLMNFSGLTDVQREILRCMSLMPSSETPAEVVKWFAFPSAELDTLLKKGWLNRNGNADSLILHDLVREYCNQEDPSPYVLETFLKGVLGKGVNQGVDISATFKGKILELQLQAIALMEEFCDSPEDLAQAYTNVGKTYGTLGDYVKALEYKRRGLDIRERVLPSDHLDLAVSYNNVGTAYSDLGDHAKALEYHLKDLTICEKMLPSDHLDLAVSYCNVGMTYGALGDHVKALNYQLKDLAICEKALSDDDPNLATAYNNVGMTYGALGEYVKALEYQLKGLAICEKVLLSDHPDVAVSYSNVGMTYVALGNYEKALEYQRKGLAIREKVLPIDHPDLAVSYNNMGKTYGALGDHIKALEYMLKDLVISERVLPSNHPNLATSYNNVGTTYSALGDHAKALEYQLKGLAIREKVLAPNHPALATSYNDMGMTYDALGNHAKALEYLFKGLAIRERALPSYHPDIARSFANIAKSYDRMNQYLTALKWAYRALDIAQYSLPEEHPARKNYHSLVEHLEQKIQK